MNGFARDGLPYLIGVAAAYAAAAAQLALAAGLGGDVSLLPFVAAVTAAAWAGGLRPGLATTALSAALADYLFVAPVGSFAVAAPHDGVRLVTFTLVGGFVSALCGRLHAELAERVRAEAARRESEERLRLAVEATGVGVLHEDLTTGRVELGGRAAELFGLPDGTAAVGRDELIARVHPDDLPVVADAAKAAAADGGRIAGVEHRVVLPAGVRWISLWGRTFFDAAGTRRLSGVVADVTDRRRAAEGLAAANHRLEESLRAKDEFLAVLAHELKNPLAPIRNVVAVLGRSADPDRVAWGRELIGRQVDQLNRLVEDLLDVSRAGRGRIALDPKAVAVADVVARPPRPAGRSSRTAATS